MGSVHPVPSRKMSGTSGSDLSVMCLLLFGILVKKKGESPGDKEICVKEICVF